MKYNIFVRFLSFLLSAIMVVTLLPLSILAEDLAADADEGEELNVEELISDISESEDSGEVEYTDPAPGLDEVRPTGDTFYTNEGFALRLNSDSASYSVVGFINAAATSITVPDNYDGKPVTHIGDSAFKDKENLEHVTIGANVVYIGDDVFGGCTNLKFNEVDGVNYIGTKDNAVFYAHSAKNSSIAEYIAPAETRIIGSYAFHNCRNLKKFALHADIIQVGFRALRGCDYIEDVTLPFAGEVKDGTANVHVGFAFGARTYGGNISFVPLTLKRLTILGGSLQKNALYGLDNVTHLGLPKMTAHLGYYYGAETYEENINYIPASLTSVSVQSGDIPDYAFYKCVKLENIDIPDNAKTIGSNTFYDCEKLSSINIPDSVTSIGEDAFYSCNLLDAVYINDLTSWCRIGFGNASANPLYYAKNPYLNGSLMTDLVIPECVTSIGSYAFYGCDSLTSITIPDSVTSIGDGAFRWCYKIKSITIPDSVTSICSYAFSDCTSLTSVTLSDSLISIGEDAFNRTAYYNDSNSWKDGVLYINNCLIKAETSVNDSYLIKAGTVCIAGGAFRKCTSLTSITIPDSLISIGSSAFGACNSLTSITIPDSVTSIGSSAFSGCSSLTSVNLGNGLTSIGSYAFYNCTSLTAVHISDIAAWCRIDFDSYYANPLYYAKKLYLNDTLVTDLIIPEGVTAIDSFAFQLCTSFTSVTIGNGVTSINENAFKKCTSLTSVTIGNSVTSIGQSAFSDCISLTSITIPFVGATKDGNSSTSFSYIFGSVPKSLKTVVITGGSSIASNAFWKCTSLKSITIGGSVTSIGSSAFYNCTSLTSVTIHDSVTTIGSYAFRNCISLMSITIPDSVTSIGTGTFEDCTSLTSVTIGNGVTSIGDDAFYNCTSLTSVTIGNGVTSIGDCAFYNCTLLTSVTIGNGVTSIGSSAFYNCASLTSVTIPDSVTSIDSYAFYRCTSLTSVTIPDGVTSIGFSVFRDCTSLTSVTIPDGVTSIDSSAFFGCTSLTSVTIPDSLISIGSYAFSDCTSLTTITIPNSVTSISVRVFNNCTSLASIYYCGSYSQWSKITLGVNWNNNTGDYTIYCSDATVSKAGEITYLAVSAVSEISATYTSTYVQPSSLLKIQATPDSASPMTADPVPSMSIFTVAEEVTYSEGLEYTSNGDGTCYVDGIGSCQDTNVVIPSVSPYGASVTSIDNSAFSGCTSLTSITIPDSVTLIENFAFKNCTSLTSVTIPNSVTSIGSSAFYNCTSLTSITIPDSVTSIEYHLFEGCTSLTSITIPDSVTSIESNAFTDTAYYNNSDNWIDGVLYISNHLIKARNDEKKIYTVKEGTICIAVAAFSGCSALGSIMIPDSVTSIGEDAFSSCTSLTNITIPDGVTSIGSYAFYECISLTSVTIPDGVTSIGSSAFRNCTSLTSVTIPDSVTTIGYSAFQGCAKLTSMTIPDSVTSIGSSVFYNCTSLTSVTIPDSVTSIGSSAFYNCTSLTSVIIPDSVKSIGERAFDYCTSLTAVHISDLAAWCLIKFGSSYANPLYYAKNLYLNGSLVTDLVIPDGVTSIGDYAFEGCTSLTSVIIPDSVKSIGERAFVYCTSLASMDIPNSATSIGDVAFYACRKLTSISIPASVNSIGASAFSGCSSLEKVTFEEGSKIGFIGSQAFDGTNLKKGQYSGNKTIYYPGDINEWRFVQKATDWDGDLAITYDQIKFGKESVTVLYDMKDDKSEFFVSEFVGTEDTEIPEIYSGRPVTVVYDKSFYKVDLGGATVSVTIPESVKTIYSDAFYNSPGIGGVHIFGKDLELPRSMITGCESLYDLTLPFLGAHLGDTENNYLGYLFGAEKREANGEYLPKMLKTVTLTDETYIPEYAFAGCSYLENVNFLADITYIGKYAFSNCISLKEFTIPDSVTEIGKQILENCSAIKVITVGAGIKSIPDIALGLPVFGIDKLSSSLEKYVVSEGNAVYSTDARGVLYEKHQSLQVEVGVIDAPAKSDLLDYVLPNHIVYIAPYAFAYNTSLRWIQLDRVRRIDRCAFFGATSLVAAVFGQKGVDVNETAADTEAYNEYLKMIAEVSEMQESYQQFIGEQAFAGCLQLRYVNLYSDFIIHIGDLAFFDCESLENIYISSSLQSLGHRVFDEAMPEYIEVEADSKYFKSVDGVLYRNTESGYILELYPARKITADSYSSDGSKQKEYETSFSLPEDLKIVAIQSYAFGDTAHLTEVDLSPASDMIIGDYAFSESNVRVVNIGDRVTSIGLLRGEGEYTVFSDCMQLSKINVSKDNPYYSSQNGVLFDKLKYKLIKYPVMKSDKEYTIPEGVSVIASMAFKDCGELVILSIPSYINTIGLEAFYGARNLSSIYFNHVYAPLSVMENAFTTSTEIEGETYDPKTMILYSQGYYENGGEDEYGWVNYEGVYNIHECTFVPEYNPAQTGKVYYAVVVVDSTGMPLDNIAVTLTDPNGVAETIVTGYSNSSATGLSESGDGIAMFYDLYGTEGMGFAIDFERVYKLSAVDKNGVYYTYTTDELMLDSDMCITYITLTLQPSVYGVDLSGKDINTETAVINKAEYGTTDRFDFINGELVVLEKDVSETVEITVIGYYDKKSAPVNDECMLYQNGQPIPGCKLIRVNDVELGVSQITFELPVDRLIPEVPIEAKIGVVSSRDGSLSTATAFLNIDVIDFALTADDITLDVGDLSIDLEAAGALLKTLLGKDDLSFNLGKNVQLSIVPDGDTVTVSLNGSYKKQKETKTGKHVESNCEKGYKKNHEAHNKNTWFFKYPAIIKGEEYTVNIRVARGTEKENYFYYQMSIYKGYYALTENMVARHFGVFNAYGGRPAVKAKSLIIYYTYMVKALDEKDITKGEVYKEPVIAPVIGSQTSHSFEVTAYGDLQFKYEKGKGLVPVASTIKGDIKYTFLHGHQFMVWVIPVYFEITVDLEGNLLIKLKYDEGVSVEEAKLTLQAAVTAQVGIGCKVLSAGVKGKIGMVFVLEFAPELGVDSWNVYGGLYAYVTYVTIKFQKGWLGLYYPVVGTDTKEAAIWEGNYYIIGGPDSGTSSASYYAVPVAALYMADAYGASEPENYTENATVFRSGGKIYKLGFVNVLGEIASETEDEYDKYNYLKLALFEWDPAAKNWGDYVLIDDNGFNDFYYSVVETENGAGVIFTQQTEKTNAETAENTYDYVSDLVVKYVDLSDIASGMTVSEVWENEYYKYLPTFNTVNGVPVAVWAQNSDNNMFGVSPKNYIDSKGEPKIFPTEANSIWTSSFVNGAWTEPTCVADGLSTVMDITVTEDGRIAYIIDTNADMSDVDDRVAYSLAYGAAAAEQITVAEGRVILSLHADDEFVTYYYDDANGGGIATYDFATSESVDVTVNGKDMISSDYEMLLDGEGNITAIIFAQPKTWVEGEETLDGTALYGLFPTAEGWGSPIEISGEMIKTESGKYISEFDAYMDQDGNVILTAEYVNNSGASIGRFTEVYEINSRISVDSYEVDYKNKKISVILTNTGALSGNVFYSVNGEGLAELIGVNSGETVYCEIDLAGYGLLPDVFLYDGEGAEAFACIDDIDLNHVDLRPAVKQLLLGGKNVLLVAVRNDGNLPSGGTLYVRVGNYTVEEMYEAEVTRTVRRLESGDIVYFEIPLSGNVKVDENTVVTVYVSTDYSELEKGKTPENNILYTTLKAFDRTVDDLGASYEPEVLTGKVEYDPMSAEEQNVEIVFTCADVSDLEGVSVNGTALVAGRDYIVSAEGAIGRIMISDSYLSALDGGEYALALTVDGKELEAELDVKLYHEVSWVISAEETVITYVEDGKIPQFNGEPTIDMSIDFVYSFSGWDRDGDLAVDKLRAAYTDEVYYALWNESYREYSVTWVMMSAEGIPVAVEESYLYGDIPSYLGTVFAPAGMELYGWNTEVLPVTGDVVYTAVYVEERVGKMTLSSEEVKVIAGSEFELEIKASEISDVDTAIIKLKYDSSAATLLGIETPEGVEIIAIEDGSLTIRISITDETREMTLLKLRMLASKTNTVLEKALLDAEGDLELTRVFGKASIYAIGDVNLDGVISAADITRLARHLAKVEPITDEISAKTCDTNRDGIISAADLTMLARYIAKIISSFD